MLLHCCALSSISGRRFSLLLAGKTFLSRILPRSNVGRAAWHGHRCGN